MADDEVAIVHDFFVQDGGAERVAIELSRMLPTATIYTSFFDAATFGSRIDAARVRTWPIQSLLRGHRFRSLLPLYPIYFSTLFPRATRLVVSSSSAFAKAVRTRDDVLHISYIHSPMRYAWALDEYLRGSSYGMAARIGAHAIRSPLAIWDRQTSNRPDVLLANSNTVRRRIKRYWRRDAQVLHPPVDLGEFSVSARDDGYLLVAARLVAYRRIDLAISAANALGRRLVVVGDGPERSALQRLAGPSVEFTGHLGREDLVALFARCSAYVVPAEEDFGISLLEAMASGKPVIALNRGGATETVVDGETGVLFETQSAAGLVDAIKRRDEIKFDPASLRAHAARFDLPRFQSAWHDVFAAQGVERSLYGPTPQPDFEIREPAGSLSTLARTPFGAD